VEEMLSHTEIDAVDICVSTESHVDVAIAALESGAHVFVERPLALTYSEAARIVDVARRANRLLMVGMNNRFQPDAMILRSFIEARELGKVFYVKAGWLRRRDFVQRGDPRKGASGGGILVNEGLVLIDFALWMLGFPDVEKVSTTAHSILGLGVEDSIVALLRLVHGGTIFIEASWAARVEEDIFYCDVFGSDGTGMLNPFRIQKIMHGNLVNVTPSKMEQGREAFQRSYQNELRHFIGAVRGLHPVVSTGEEALHRMRLVRAMYRSIEQREEIQLEP
jgi:predicted dehydrogenase